MLNTVPDQSMNQTDYSRQHETDEINLVELLGTLLDGKWLIATITLIALFLGITITILGTPIYKADGLLQVKEKTQSVIGFEPLTGILDGKMPVLTEIELIKSRMILGKTIKSLNLNIVAEPKYFPVIGSTIARKYQANIRDNSVSSPVLELTQYAWGGEAIHIDSLTVPADWEDKKMILQASSQGQFKLFYNNEMILEGEVGKLVTKKIENRQQPVTIFVSLLKSRPGTQFIVMRQSDNQAIRLLKESISIAEKGKNTSILELTVESYNPESAVRILNEIANIYVMQSVEQKSAESQKTLEFLEKQLPILKDQLEAATSALNEFRTRKGSVDLDLETQNVLKGSVELKMQVTLLQQKRDDLRQRYTESHPTIISIDKQIARLNQQITSHDKSIEELPETQQIILRLSRDVRVSTELYTTLLNNAQTLRVAKAGTIGNVRIIDYAVLPDKPIKPKKILIVGTALILGFVLGILAALLRKMLHHGVEDPDLIERHLNIPVYATIPHSDFQETLARKYSKNAAIRTEQPILLAYENKDDLAVESLRSLRTSLHFAFLKATNNIIMIAGPSPNIGKSFVSVNLAVVMADAGKKILLIDGDMRKSTLHKKLNVSRENGLSDLIMDAIKIEEAIHHIPQVDIDFISSGFIPPNPSELLLHERFGRYLNSVSKQYDFVIIDSPPIMAVTDAAIIGNLAGAVLMVIKAGQHPMRELEQSTRRLIQAGVNLKGIVVNDITVSTSRYGHGKYVYQYSYKSER